MLLIEVSKLVDWKACSNFNGEQKVFVASPVIPIATQIFLASFSFVIMLHFFCRS